METTMQETQVQKMLDHWFEKIIGKLRDDQSKIKMGLATPEKEEFYKQFVTKPADELTNDFRRQATMFNVEKALKQYSFKLNEYGRIPLKLALHLFDSKILIFAIVKDDDEETENALFLTEAYINAEFEQYGLHVSTTILEESDNYIIPDHYKILVG